MTASEPLQGSELIDCARANSNKGIATAAERCGYGDSLNLFEQELRKAGEAIGVHIQNFSDLTDTPHKSEKDMGIEIAPETPTQF